MTLPTNPANPGPAPKQRFLRRHRKRTLIAVAAVSFLGLFGALYCAVRHPFRADHADLQTRPIGYEPLELKIVDRGTLESSRNADVYCQVKAGTRGATNASTIKWVIEDGSTVKKGDLVAELDDSGLQDQLKTEKIALDGAEAERINAEEDYKITVSQNESDIGSAEVKLKLSQIDLQKYREGDFPQQLQDVEGKIKEAEGDVDQQRDRTAWANRMVKKGYMTAVQSQAEQSKLESLELVLEGFVEQKRVLCDPEYGLEKRSVTDLENQVAENERALERTKVQAASKEAQARALREAKKSIWEEEKNQYQELLEEIKKCKLYAPQSGMVVYYIPDQARYGGGAQQGIIAQGEPVREGQKLMQIPDLNAMRVDTKVHEALVSRVQRGQPATVRVDPFPDRLLRGHVEQVAPVSAQQDFMSADVKVYQTKVVIDEPLEGLRPGMSADVTITVAATLDRVLALPVQAIVGSAELGGKRICFVQNERGEVEKRDVVLGESNDRLAEVKDGLHEGDQVVMNPRALVGDTARVRERRGDEDRSGDERGAGRPGKGRQTRGDRPPE